MKLKIMGPFLSRLKKVGAITLAPFGIYFKKKQYLEILWLVNHEKIHWKQQVELLFIFFYLWYGIEWLIKIILPPHKNAYDRLSFEREASLYENDLRYLEYRKPYTWIKYIFKEPKKLTKI